MKEELISWRMPITGVVALMYSFVLSIAVFGGETGQQPERFVFELEEVSAFELDNRVVLSFINGKRCYCTEKPADEVKVYPVFKTDKPLYGFVEFWSEYDGEQPRRRYYFALDESPGTGEGYDRLYFDMSRDLDLTNDTVLSPHKNPPNKKWFGTSRARPQTTFEYLNVPFKFGSEGVRPLQILPWFVVSGNQTPVMKFVNPMARKGNIELGGRSWDVFLGHDYMITGWFDRPLTAFNLFPQRKWDWIGWRGGDRLMAVHKIEDTLYQFSATPKGDKLIVQECDGPFGSFEVRLGGRDNPAGMISANSSLRSRDVAIAVSGRKCRLPVGDYLPSYLTVNFADGTKISLSDNYHVDGEPRGAVNRPKNYAIKIREDEPYILDFSNEPEVIFASPAKGCRLKRGEELTVKAVLVDPKLDVMIRDLDMKVRLRSAGGSENSLVKYIPGDPTVTMTRSDDSKVAEGTMPFG